VDLDRKRAKEILAYNDAGKQALREIVSQSYNVVKYIGKSMYTPPSNFMDSGLNQDTTLGLVGVSWILGNFFTAIAMENLPIAIGEEVFTTYFFTILGINSVDGIYNIFKSKRDKIAKENLSKLEQITNGEED